LSASESNRDLTFPKEIICSDLGAGQKKTAAEAAAKTMIIPERTWVGKCTPHG
jgi:hypothetical protein